MPSIGYCWGLPKKWFSIKTGIDFDAELGSLIVFDEADTFMTKQNDTRKFSALIDSCFYIYLTATLDDGDDKGLLRTVVDTLHPIQLCF